MIVPAVVPQSIANTAGDLRPQEWLEKGFNNVALSKGSGRHRKELNEAGKEAVGAVLHATARAHSLDVAGLSFRPAGLYAIVNTLACTKPQGMHTDYSRHMVEHLDGTLIPRSAIWAPSAAFRLGAEDHPEGVFVPRGHVIFFRHDWWHCGGTFLTSKPRFHGFQLPPMLPVPSSVYTN